MVSAPGGGPRDLEWLPEALRDLERFALRHHAALNRRWVLAQAATHMIPPPLLFPAGDVAEICRQLRGGCLARIPRWCDGSLISCVRRKTLPRLDCPRPTGRGGVIFSGDALLQNPGCGPLPRPTYDTRESHGVPYWRSCCHDGSRRRLDPGRRAFNPEKPFFRQLNRAGGRPSSSQ